MRVDKLFLSLAMAGSMLVAFLTSACRSTPANRESLTSSANPAPTTFNINSNSTPGLQGAMGKLLASIEKPAAPFHVSFKKIAPGGFSYATEADVSSDGITGKETDLVPNTQVFPASAKVRDINGVPLGGSSWGRERTTMAMAYLNGHIGDAQEGAKYVGDEQVGGFDTRRYDFDLTDINSDSKKAMVGGSSFAPGVRKLKDYNVKGSGWIANEDGRMVKFQYDSIMLFSDGENDVTHFEGLVTKK